MWYRGYSARCRKIVNISAAAYWMSPCRGADAALRILILKLPRNTGTQADSTVSASHVRNWSARRHRPKSRSLRDHVRDLVATPTVPLYADGVLVDEPAIHHLLHRWQHALQRALSGLPCCVHDVRFQNQVTIAHVVRRIDIVAGPRLPKRIYV